MCPRCGSAAAVHSVAEWAAMAQGPMGQQWQPGAPMPGSGPAPRPGYGPQPASGPAPQPPYPAAPGQQSGFPDPSQYQQSVFPDPSQYQQSGFPDPSQYQQSGFPDPSQYQQPGPPDPSPYQQPESADPTQHPSASSAEPPPAPQPGYPAGPPPAPQPGYPAGPPPGPSAGEPWPDQPPPRRPGTWYGISDSSSLEEGIADAVMGAATKALGGVIGRRMRKAYNERVAPAMAARQEAAARDRMAIAQRHPNLYACLTDQVVFLAGGTRVLPLASALAVRTVEQSDALVAQLQG
jgi:hypothetical protein